VTFDPFDPANFDDPIPGYHWMLEEDPLHWCAPQNMWLMTRFDDVWNALRDPATFSSASYRIVDEQDLAFEEKKSKSIVMMDPPRHDRLRSLVSRAFTLRRMQEMRSRVRELTLEHLALLRAQATPDFATSLAIPLPGIVIADAVGVEREHIARLAEATVAMVLVDPADPAYPERYANAVATLDDYFLPVIERRRSEPTDDLISSLIDAEIDGERLTDGEIAGFARALFNGGHGTTTTQLGGSVVALAQNPDERQRVIDDPPLLRGAVEELIRFVAPVQGLMRTVTRDVELHGRTMHAGDKLMVLIAAANRDPRVFEDPDRLDLTRPLPRHLGFGVGVHFCIGAQLARVETEVVLEELLRIAPSYEISGEIHYENIMSVRSLHSVPIALQPA
jgi:cytochrome P450